MRQAEIDAGRGPVGALTTEEREELGRRRFCADRVPPGDGARCTVGYPRGVPHLDMGPSFGAWIGLAEPRGAGRRCPGSWRIRGWVSGPGGYPEPCEAMKITEITHGKPGRAKKSDGLLRQGECVRFAFIGAEKAAFPVRLLCQTLAVSRAGFYAWASRPRSARAGADERLGLEIAAIHVESRRRYGSPRGHAELTARGCRTGRKRVARLMRTGGLAARRRRQFRVTTQSRHPFPIAPNVLARQFARTEVDQAWVTDITYIPTGEGGSPWR